MLLVIGRCREGRLQGRFLNGRNQSLDHRGIPKDEARAKGGGGTSFEGVRRWGGLSSVSQVFVDMNIYRSCGTDNAKLPTDTEYGKCICGILPRIYPCESAPRSIRRR
jgi:hypothetical protein